VGSSTAREESGGGRKSCWQQQDDRDANPARSRLTRDEGRTKVDIQCEHCRELSAAVRKLEETVALRDPIMPVTNGFGG
jgi:hypothetical protein